MNEENERNLFQETLLKIWEKIKIKLKEWNKVRAKYWYKYHVNKILLLVFLSAALVITTYFYVGSKITNVEALKSNLEQTTVVYDREMEEAGTLYSQKGTSIALDSMSPWIQRAVISTEDQKFLEHSGFDVIGIGRAAVGYVTNFGRIVGGGSTITQQLAKNAYLSADQTLLRKVKELFLSIEIEKQYSKAEILEMYLNNVYFGNGVWGVEDASQKYFGKSAANVNISEGAMLAGMLTAPSTINPYDNYDVAINRKNTVLYLMYEQGHLTGEEYQAEENSGLSLNDNYDANDRYTYPWFFDAVISEAINKYNIKEEELLNNGYKIYTTLDQNHQRQMNAVYTYDGLFPTASDGTPVESASVAIHPQTGGVTAIFGGRGKHTFRGYNRGTQMKRQPGSIIKPLTVYTPALESGYGMMDELVDREISYGSEEYIPYNFDKTFDPEGAVPMYEAVAESLNAPAVWLLNEIGIEKGIAKGQSFGLEFPENDRNLAAVALGGMSKGVSPIQMASAYTVFANEGYKSEAHFITQIVDSTGRVVVDNSSPTQKRVTSAATARSMNSMLQEVFGPLGTAYGYAPAGYSVAGKTGTTDSRFGTGAADKWLVSYTPDLVIAGWIGFDEPSEINSLTYAHDISSVVKLEMEAILPYTSGTLFEEIPASVISKESGEDPGNLWNDIQDRFKALYEGFFGSSPSEPAEEVYQVEEVEGSEPDFSFRQFLQEEYQNIVGE